MKIAILGDIHGNIEALKTAYNASVSNNVEKIYHLGDLGGYAPFVNEVVDFLIEHKGNNYSYLIIPNYSLGNKDTDSLHLIMKISWPSPFVSATK